MQKSIKKNALLNTLKTVLALFFPLITFPYSSRILGPENLGKVNFSQAVVSYFTIIASLGISTYATREVAKVRDNQEQMNKISTEIFFINMASTIFSYILLAVSLVFVKKFNDYRLLICVCSSLIVFTTLGMGWLYQAVEDYLYITVRSLIFQIISVILLFTFVKTKDDYIWYAAVNIISNVGANILNFVHSRKFISFYLKKDLEFKKHLKPIFILFATALTGTIFSSIDKTMLGFMSGDVQVGLYSAGVKLISMVNGVFSALVIVVFPRISYYLANDDKKNINALYSKTINVLLCFAIPISMGLFLLMEPLVLLFCGQKYVDAINVSRILCPYLIFSSFSYFMGNTLLIAYGKEKNHLYIRLIATGVDVILNAIFIVKFGAFGAAFATLLSQIVICILDYFVLKDVIKNIHFVKSVFQFLLAALVMGICVFFVCKFFDILFLQLVISFLCGIFVYALMLFFLRNEFFIEVWNEIIKKLKNIVC